MSNLPQISESELILIKIIWECNNSALYADIMNELERRGYDWKKNTVLTFLSRLVEKKMLRISKIGRRNEYTALISEQDYQSEETKLFLNKVYDGNIQDLVHMLLRNDFVSAQDAEELRNYWMGGSSDD